MTLTFDLFLQIFGFALPIVGAVYTFIATRRKDVNERLDRHEQRLQTVEHTLLGQPNKEDIHDLQLAMERISGSIEVLKATMDGNNKVLLRMESIVGRHEDHLLNGGSK